MIRISEKDVVRFTEGDCHILAKELEKATGWQAYAFSTGPYESEYIWDLHAFVMNRNCSIVLDVEGLRDFDEFTSYWSCDEVRAIDDWSLFELEWKGPQFGSYSRRRARQIAAYFAETFDLT